MKNKQMARYKSPIRYPATFIIPALLVYGMFYLFPTFSGFYYSMTSWNSKSIEYHFVGLSQIVDVIKNPIMQTALKNTFIFAALTVIFENILALALAIGLNQKIKGRTALRAIFFSPAILNIVACGMVFKGLMNPNTGLFNTILRSIGLNVLANGWYTDSTMAIYSTVFMDIWRASGINMAIYLAGLQSIPRDYYEAALIDGAHGWSMFRKITLPLISKSVTVNVVLTTIGGLRIFDVVYYLTNGGPGNASQVMQTLAYTYMGKGYWGYSSAISVVLVVIILFVSIPLLLLLRNNDKKVAE